MVNEEHVYIWRQGVKDCDEWVLLLYQGTLPWPQRRYVFFLR